MTEKRDEKTEICKILSLVCHIEIFKIRHAGQLRCNESISIPGHLFPHLILLLVSISFPYLVFHISSIVPIRISLD